MPGIWGRIRQTVLVNCILLYDLVDIKKKQVTHQRLQGSQMVQNRFFF